MRISDWSSDVCSSDLGDQHHALGEHPLEQAPEQHRVADVAAEELGEHQHPQLLAPLARDRHQRVARAGVGAQALVHAAHEAVERSEEHKSDHQSLMGNSYAVCRLKNTSIKS